MSVEVPRPQSKFSLPPFIRRFFGGSNTPQLEVSGQLSEEDVRAKGLELIEDGIRVLKLSRPFFLAMASAHRGSMHTIEKGQSPEVNIMERFSTDEGTRYKPHVVEDRSKKALALMMAIEGPDSDKNPFLGSITVDLRPTKPEISYKDNTPGVKSPSPNTEEAVAKVRQTLKDLEAKLSPSIPVNHN